MKKEIMENVKIDSIIPYARNPRKNDEAIEEVKKSIQSVGYRTPIIVDEKNIILAGHTRFKALKELGWGEIPFVIKFTDLTEEKKKEFRIRDNKTGEVAERDFEMQGAVENKSDYIIIQFDDLDQYEITKKSAG